MAELDSLKKDLDNLASNIRITEKEMYEKIDSLAKDLYDNIKATNKEVTDQNISLKIVIEKLSIFIDTFKNHDENEMKKYADILNMFEKVETTIKQRDKDTKDTYVTKEEFLQIKIDMKENTDAIKKGWQLFYKVSGGVTMLVVVGGLFVWILNLYSKLQALGV